MELSKANKQTPVELGLEEQLITRLLQKVKNTE